MIYLWFFIATVQGQLISPCPNLFEYERNKLQNDIWYGTVTLLSNSELLGIRLRLTLDKPSIQLGNWFGEIVTSDNKEYQIINYKHKLLANTPFNFTFFIRYNPVETPPQLTTIQLNGKTVCPENGIVTENPVTTTKPTLLITSSVLSTTGNPLTANDANARSDVLVAPYLASEENDDSVKKEIEIDAGCGTVVLPPRPLITHGEPTREGEFPWHAALYYLEVATQTYICGATLISRYHLITLAHCVVSRQLQKPLDTSKLIIYLGKYYLKQFSNPGIQDRQPDKITVHPQYNSNTWANNIAVLRVAQPFEITIHVRPVCLWNEDTTLQVVIDKIGTVVGFGWDENGRVAKKLTAAKMPVVSFDTCVASFPEFYFKFTSTKTFCAGFKNGTSVCNFDSGGGLVFPKTQSNSDNPIWQVRGIAEAHLQFQNVSTKRCDILRYAIFTDVAKYLDWIRASLD